MKRKIAILLVVCLVAGLAFMAVGCGTQESASESPAASESASVAPATESESAGASEVAGDLSGEGYKIGLLPFETGDSWFGSLTAGGKWYLESKGAEVDVQDAQWDTMQYNTICNTWATDDDLTAVIAAPLGGEEVATGLQALTAAGKKVAIVNNEAGNLPDVLFCVRYDGKEGCAGLAQKVVDLIQAQKGEVKGVNILGLGDTKNPEHVERANAMKEVFAKYPDLEIRDFDSGMTADTATTRTADLLRTEDNVVGVVSVGMLEFIGMINALQRENMAVPASDPNHIVCAGMDTCADVINPAIKDGTVDFAVDQPVLAYNVIASYYMLKYLNEGESALPKPGDTINPADLDIQIKLPVEGSDLMTPPDSWGPATVVDETADFGHIWIKTQYLVVDQSNVDDPLLWSNITNLVTDFGF